MSEVERQVASLSGQCHGHDEKLQELAAVLRRLQARVDQMDGDGGGTLSLVRRAVGRPSGATRAGGLSGSEVVPSSSPGSVLFVGMKSGRGTEGTGGRANRSLGAVCCPVTGSSGGQRGDLVPGYPALQVAPGLRLNLKMACHNSVTFHLSRDLLCTSCQH